MKLFNSAASKSEPPLFARPDTSDGIVEALQPYGTVDVFQSDSHGGFSAACNLRMGVIQAKIHSDFRHKSMLSALIDLHEKVLSVCHLAARGAAKEIE